MADSVELAERLYRRFKGVPNFEESDARELVEDAMQEHGYAPTAEVPKKNERLVLLYAQFQAAWQIAFSVAHYFKFVDGEEEIDKSMVSSNYRSLAKDLQEEYEKERYREHGSAFKIMHRVDRP